MVYILHGYAFLHVFRADRPFAFVIYNWRLGGALFLGKVGDPTAG
jgi:hypothetical protein